MVLTGIFFIRANSFIPVCFIKAVCGKILLFGMIKVVFKCKVACTSVNADISLVYNFIEIPYVPSSLSLI